MAMVMPGELRRASPRVVVAWDFISSPLMTVTAWGVSWMLVDGMTDTGGAWFSTFLSLLSWTVTGPSVTGCAMAGMAISRAARDAPERAMDLRCDMEKEPLQDSALVSSDLAGFLKAATCGRGWLGRAAGFPIS